MTLTHVEDHLEVGTLVSEVGLVLIIDKTATFKVPTSELDIVLPCSEDHKYRNDLAVEPIIDGSGYAFVRPNPHGLQTILEPDQITQKLEQM